MSELSVASTLAGPSSTMTKNLDQQHGRADHRAVSVGDSLYVWGGAQFGLPLVHRDNKVKTRFTSNIQHFTPSTGQWVTRCTTGTPPLGIIGYCCTAINDLLYYFGGYCGHDICYHNSITQLDTVSLQWRELEPTDATRPVMRRGFGGMISFEHDGVHHLLMIGGLGSKSAVQLPHYKYIELTNGRWRSNEHSIYNISSRKWSNPLIIGQCIPPASVFIIEKINNTRAVLFGGLETNNDAKAIYTNNIYILEISINTVFWQCIKKPEAIDQWPVARFLHAGAIVMIGLDCPILVISGGWDKNNDTLDDCWIFNITQHSWIKLDVPHSVSKRWGHSFSVFIMSPHCVWIITVGGYVDRSTLVTNPNIAMLTELVLNSKGEWTVGDTLDTNGMNNEEYKKKYQQQLQLVRRIWLEEYQKPKKGDTADIEQTVQALMKSLEEKEREAQVFRQQMEQKEKEEAEKDQEIRRYRHQLQEKDREEAEKEQRYHNQLQEKEKEKAKKEKTHQALIALKTQEIQQYRNQLQEKEKEKAEMEQRYFWKLQESERKNSLKGEEMQRYHYQLREKEQEIQKYIYQLQEKERKEVQQDQIIQGYCQQLQEKAAKEQEIQKYCENLKEEVQNEKEHHHQQLQEKEAIKEKEIQRYRQELQKKGEKEAEKEHQLLEEQRLKDKYFQQLQEKGKELAEKEQMMHIYYRQLQEKEREEAQRREYYNDNIQKKRELENEIQRLNQLLQNKDEELIESNQKLKEHLQQIQQHEQHLKDVNIQEEETRVDQEKVQEIKLLHSSEEDKELQEDVKTAPKEDNSKGNNLHESIQGCYNDFSKILDEKVVESVTEDELKGVHVAAKNSFLIHGGSTQSVNWEGYGIRITIPQGAVLPSDTVQVTITALVGGDFIFPEDSELVSAVYAISLSKPFLEPVKLEIQHCVSIETSSHCDYLSFSTSINNQPPYQFDTVDGGEFSIGNRYGSISIATFSKYCIKTYSGRRYQPYSIPGPSSLRTRTHTPSSSLLSSFEGPYSAPPSVSSSSFNDELHSSSSSLTSEPHTLSTRNEVTTLADKPPIKCYHSQVMYEIKRPGREWLMRFLVSKDLNALIEHIKKQLGNVEKGIEVSFQFKDDDGFIELCFDGQCPKGWSVRPHQDPTRIRQNDIDEYGSMSPPRFPGCLITITATPGEGAVKELSYPVMLQGIKKSNFEKINIVLTMGDFQFQQASAGTIASNSVPVSPGIVSSYNLLFDADKKKLAGKVLRENFDTLSKILAAPSNLSAVIMSLYAKELISNTTATECMNAGRPVHDRCASLLFTLTATIDGQPQLMITLIEALKNNEAFKEIADKMELEVSYQIYTKP